MAKRDLNIVVDIDGFLKSPEDWTEEMAEILAHREGIARMTEKHWKLVWFVRNHYEEQDFAPVIRDLCKGTQFSLKEIYDLFPSGPAAGVCKVAGLKKPTGCV